MNMKSISSRFTWPEVTAHILIDSNGLKAFGASEWLLEKHGQRSRRN